MLRVDRPPFDDARLREAVRYGIDRDELVRVALLGRGRPGNDMFCQGLQYYPDVEQVVHDPGRGRVIPGQHRRWVSKHAFARAWST